MQWQNPLFFAFFLGIVIFVLFLFMILVVWQVKKYTDKVKQEEANKLQLLKKHQQQLANATIISMEKERKRIAADLHDELTGHLRRILFINTNKTLEKELKTVIDTARNISHDLTPPMLEHLPMSEIINSLLYPLKEKYIVNITIDDTEHQTINNIDTKLHLFRILQELLNNIIVHAQANAIDIYFTNSEKQLMLSVADNGIGVNSLNHKNKGIGLQNIEMRSQLINATYKYSPNTPRGTKFELYKTHN